MSSMHRAKHTYRPQHTNPKPRLPSTSLRVPRQKVQTLHCCGNMPDDTALPYSHPAASLSNPKPSPKPESHS